MLTTWATWIASITTVIASIMMATNLGARITGIGFAIIAVGSIGWTVVGVSSGQTGLIVTDGFLTLVNFFGIWRWLLRQQTYEQGGKSAKSASRKSSAPALFTATGIAGMPVVDADGGDVGKAVEALIECEGGTVSYVVVSTTEKDGVKEELRAVPHNDVTFRTDGLKLAMRRAAFDALSPLPSGDWPARAE